MKIYIKDNKIKSANKIVIYKDDMQILNPTEEMILEDGWVEYKQPELTPEEILINTKKDKIIEIEQYDSSPMVNEFYVNDNPIWLDKATRAGLKLRFEAELASGQETTTLWYEGLKFTMPIELGVNLLMAIELYASACYDNTQSHLSNIDKIISIEGLEVYDYTTGYPEKLHFNI